MNNACRLYVALAVLAAAAVLPAAASAENDVTLLEVNEGAHGSPLTVGTKLLATSNHTAGTRITDASKNTVISCTTNELTGELKRNDHTLFQWEITAASFKGIPEDSPHGSHCLGSTGATLFNFSPTNGLPWCLQAHAANSTHSFTVRGSGCTKATRPIRFTLQITTVLGAVHCEYERAEAIAGTYTTSTTPTLTLSHVKFSKVATDASCPAETFLDLEMQLHRDPGELAIVNAT